MNNNKGKKMIFEIILQELEECVSSSKLILSEENREK